MVLNFGSFIFRSVSAVRLVQMDAGFSLTQYLIAYKTTSTKSFKFCKFNQKGEDMKHHQYILEDKSDRKVYFLGSLESLTARLDQRRDQNHKSAINKLQEPAMADLRETIVKARELKK